MPRRSAVDQAAPFQTINAAARITGLSRDFIRKGVKAGTIPALKVGDGAGVYMVDVPRFLDQLHEKAVGS